MCIRDRFPGEVPILQVDAAWSPRWPLTAVLIIVPPVWETISAIFFSRWFARSRKSVLREKSTLVWGNPILFFPSPTETLLLGFENSSMKAWSSNSIGPDEIRCKSSLLVPSIIFEARFTFGLLRSLKRKNFPKGCSSGESKCRDMSVGKSSSWFQRFAFVGSIHRTCRNGWEIRYRPTRS